MASPRICSIDGCDKRATKRGWCGAHWMRWRRHGDPLAGGTPSGAPEKWIQSAITSGTDDCLIWPFGTTGNGYPKVGGGKDTRMVHRVVCEAVHGAPTGERGEAAHNCGTALCCNPRHLRWATRAENLADRIEHGTSNRGERCGTAKLDRAKIAEIRALKGKMSQRMVAAKYGISQSHVSLIHRGKTWAWL